MATIDPNQGIPGTDETAGSVLGTDSNPEQAQSFTDFLKAVSPNGETAPLQPTGVAGEYTLPTSDGGIIKVIDTDEANLELTQPIVVESGETLILGGSKDVNVQGSSGDEEILGNAGNNQITGGAGNDLLGGGAGDDTFIFGLENGDDVITDFSVGDSLKIADFSGDGSFSANDYSVQDNPDGSGATITFADGSSVFLQGVNAVQLNPISATGEITLNSDLPLASNSADSSDSTDSGDASGPDGDDSFFTIT